jgi:hypothetical protein
MYIGPFGDINVAKLKLYMNPEEGDKDKGGESPPTTKASLLLRAALNIDKSKEIVDTSANLKPSTHFNPSANTSRSTNPSLGANPNASTLIPPELYDNIIQAYNITKNPKTNAAMLSRFSEVHLYIYVYINKCMCIYVYCIIFVYLHMNTFIILRLK